MKTFFTVILVTIILTACLYHFIDDKGVCCKLNDDDVMYWHR